MATLLARSGAAAASFRKTASEWAMLVGELCTYVVLCRVLLVSCWAGLGWAEVGYE